MARISNRVRRLKSEAIPQSFVLPPDVVPVLRRYHLRRLSWTPLPLRLLLLFQLPNWTPRLPLL